MVDFTGLRFLYFGSRTSQEEPKIVDVNLNLEIKLPEQQEKFLKGKIDDIEDKDLAATLQKLGREIFKKD